MYLPMKLVIYVIYLVVNKALTIQMPIRFNNSMKYSYNELNDHTMVTKSDVFPYMAAVLKKSTYLSAGALIDENFVLTAADSLFLLRESKRVLRVRLGSINYRKGGVLIPIKYYEIHPYFSDTKPEFDIALIKLAYPVRLTPSLYPIRLQKWLKDVAATHFIVNSWPQSAQNSDNLQHLQSMEEIKRRRMLQVSHLHPTDRDKCKEEIERLDINATETLMCLDPALGSEPCSRDVGAPVVLNGVLWGIMSSWKSAECEVEPGASFVTLVAANNITTWIHATVRGHRWSRHLQLKTDDTNTLSDENDDNND